MIGRGFWRGKDAAGEIEPNKGFDAFELRLGDLMRGERATLGKSLLDVQRELKIKAAYIAAIENADPSAFDTPGFIAGYVRSYARYLNMDPDWAFERFCGESGFQTAHGMSAAASSLKPQQDRPGSNGLGKDIFAESVTPFIPAHDGFLARVEPRAIGSVLVLIALIGGLGYGAVSVLREVQKVEFAPIDQAPTVIADVDPLAGATRDAVDEEVAFVAPSANSLERLYERQALDTPVLVPRDGPIRGADPGAGGAPSAAPVAVASGIEMSDTISTALAAAVAAEPEVPMVQVREGPVPELQLVAARPAWVRVRAADGSTLFEGILNPGDTFEVPATAEPATLRVGESGALYFAVNGVAHGPVGPSGTVTSNVALDAAAIATAYQVADLTQDADLASIVRVAQATPVAAD